MSRKPGSWRPTLLKLADRHCPGAVSLYLEGAKQDRRIFASGTAAHAVLEEAVQLVNALGEDVEPLTRADLEPMADQVAEKLIREGRSFEGDPEGPLPASAVWAGVNRALDYLESHPLDPTLGLKAELGLAVDEDFQPAPYSKGARLRLILDLGFSCVEVDEEEGIRVLVHRDYKSAPSTDASELDTVQLKAQTVLLLAHNDDGEGFDALRQEVVNLTLGATYPRTIPLDLEGLAVVDRWRREVEVTMQALDDGRDDEGRYRFRPGGGCHGCPYLGACPEGRSWASETRPDDPTPEDRARRYAVLKAAVDALGGKDGILRDDAREMPINLGDGREVGTAVLEGVELVEHAGPRIWEEWSEDGGQAPGLLAGLSLGVGNLRALARELYPADKEERLAWIERYTQPKLKPRFGIHKARTKTKGEGT